MFGLKCGWKRGTTGVVMGSAFRLTVSYSQGNTKLSFVLFWNGFLNQWSNGDPTWRWKLFPKKMVINFRNFFQKPFDLAVGLTHWSCTRNSLLIEIKILCFAILIHRKVKTNMTFTLITLTRFPAFVSRGDNGTDEKIHLLVEVFNKGLFLLFPLLPLSLPSENP